MVEWNIKKKCAREQRWAAMAAVVEDERK